MADIQKYIDDAKDRLDRLGAELKQLDAEAAAAGAEAEARLQRQSAEMRRQWRETQAMVEKLTDAHTRNVEEARRQMQQHWDALENAYNAYRDSLRK